MKSKPSRQKSVASVVRNEVWLLGQPPLRDYLEFVKEFVIGGEELPPAPLVEEWNRANGYYQQLEDLEAGIADQAESFELDAALAPFAAEVTAHGHYRETFDSL